MASMALRGATPRSGFPSSVFSLCSRNFADFIVNVVFQVFRVFQAEIMWSSFGFLRLALEHLEKLRVFRVFPTKSAT
jgi:hypothetical protein